MQNARHTQKVKIGPARVSGGSSVEVKIEQQQLQQHRLVTCDSDCLGIVRSSYLQELCSCLLVPDHRGEVTLPQQAAAGCLLTLILLTVLHATVRDDDRDYQY